MDHERENADEKHYNDKRRQTCDADDKRSVGICHRAVGVSDKKTLCKSGKLPCITGKRYLINRDVLLRFLGIELKYE